MRRRRACLLVPATDSSGTVGAADRGELVCLVSRLDGDAVVETALFMSETIATAGEQAAQVCAASAMQQSVMQRW